MKETYQTPEALTVELNSNTNILTGSDDLHEDGKGNIVGGLQDENAYGSGLVKEKTNIWDVEW